MNITIIACCDKNGLIGMDGKMPWYIPEELRRFKTLTFGHAVIMGRGTYESMGKKPLPGRYNLVITKKRDYARNREGAIFINSPAEALQACAHSGHEEVFIIGGEKVYKEAFDYADRILLTRLDAEYCPGLAKEIRYFPEIPDHFELDYFERYPKRGITFETWTLK
jgi:dihydrofolate reductase